MYKTLSRYWWLVALRGVLAIIFGVLAFAWPNITVGVLVLLFGVYAFIDGVSALIAGVTDRATNRRWWVLLLEGFAGIFAGVAAFLWTGITAITLFYVIAAWAVVTGVMEIMAAVSLREKIDNEWALGLSGIASIIFGGLLMFAPATGALALVWVIGAYAILFGSLMLYLSYRIKDAGDVGALRGI
ncbi:MAG TPA: HdeD family acid-resistance protein [Anaerolineae bacterium]|nr:HdeD family acid-resistance protein [Anaerolineae bacterium]